eukprot:m51a1_g7155 hypothetical protein (391) ;mRNA; f:343257-345021
MSSTAAPSAPAPLQSPRAAPAAEEEEEALWAAHYREPLVSVPSAVRVQRSPVGGKGVVAASAARAGHALFDEAPLVCHVAAEVPRAAAERTCAQCLRGALTRELLAPFGSDLYDAVYEGRQPAMTACPRGCGEVYCSPACRDLAWRLHHSRLCPGADRAHPMRRYRALCAALRLTSPLLVARMAAMSLASPDWALRWSAFVSEPWPCDRDAELSALLVAALAASGASESDAAAVAGLGAWRALHGVLQLNASAVRPLTDLHVWIDAQAAAAARAGRGGVRVGSAGGELPLERVAEFMRTPFMRSLGAHGTALFAVANTLNHSCAPNAVFASASNGSALRVVAARDVRAGEELLVSYVDEEQPREQRRAELRRRYHFDCLCDRCRSEGGPQ